MLENSQLGKKSSYESNYNPNLLFPIPRDLKRLELGINLETIIFFGADIWTHYEISWLNLLGKPMVAIGEIIFPAHSKNIIESKSMKLYFNSFNSSKFADENSIIKTVVKDLSNVVDDLVEFNLIPLNKINEIGIPPGKCLDELEIICDKYQPFPEYLTVYEEIVCEEVYTNLLKSNCLVTNQPDFGSVYIKYAGQKIDHKGLLRYIVSLRDHNEFHEQCVERIFCDILQKCKPSLLTVYARYTRRGGLEINPYRTTEKNFIIPKNTRLSRQ